MSAMLVAVAAGEGPARPFPQHTRYTEGTRLPSRPQSQLDAEVVSFYKLWKKRYVGRGVTGQRFVFANPEKGVPKEKGGYEVRVVSEGMGYGMLAVALMAGADPDAQPLFDAFYRYVKAHPSRIEPRLMAWLQVYKPGSTRPLDREADKSAATDGDLDIAAALLIADKQWGSKGGIDYRREALTRLQGILAKATDPASRTFRLGDWVDPESRYGRSFRTSDFMPAHLRAFEAADGDIRWSAINNQFYSIFTALVARQLPPNGLLPDFAVWAKVTPRPKGGDSKTPVLTYQPAPPKFLEAAHDGAYFYNACRVPWRLGTDYLLHGDRRALAVLTPFNTWAREVTGGDPSRFNAGYRLDGKPIGTDRSAAFLAPLAVAALADSSPEGQRWIDASWDALVGRDFDEDAYYGNTIRLLSMIVISGNWWQ